jgi:hypothetical protein
VAPVGRDRSEAGDAGGEGRRRDFDLRARRIDHLARVGHLERDFGEAGAVRIDPPDAPARPEDDGAIVGQPVHLWVDAVHRPGLLEVEIHVVVDAPLLAGAQILDEQARLAALPAHEGEHAPVRRRRRAARAAGAARHLRALAGAHVVALDGEHLQVRILRIFEDRTRRGVAAEIDGRAVGREDRLAQLLLVLRVGARDERDARARAAGMVEPDLAGAERALRREVLARRDILSVGGPGRAVQKLEILARDLAPVLAVGVHHPDVVAAAAVGRVGDLPAVRREARMAVERQPVGDARRAAARDGDGVDIPEQVEGDRSPVGADVEVQPRPFGNVDVDLAPRQRRVGDVPALLPRLLPASPLSLSPVVRLLVAGPLALLGEGGGGGQEEKGERGEAFDHGGLSRRRGAGGAGETRGRNGITPATCRSPAQGGGGRAPSFARSDNLANLL